MTDQVVLPISSKEEPILEVLVVVPLIIVSTKVVAQESFYKSNKTLETK